VLIAEIPIHFIREMAMAKLYYDPDLSGIHVRADDDANGVERMIEVTAEQAAAISLSGIRNAVAGVCDVLDENLPALAHNKD
jgi:hypothetical protein